MGKVTSRSVGICAIIAIGVLAGPLVGTSFAADTGGTGTPSGPVTASSTSGPTATTSSSGPAPTSSTSAPVGASASSTVVTVSPSNLHGWTFINDVTDLPETGTFVTGPATPPMGTGSVQLTAATTTESHMIATQAYAGTSLSSISTLTYSTYQAGPPSPLAIALQFDIRYRPADTGYGGRLVYEPYQNGTVTVPSGWNQWDAISASALWWASKQALVNGTNGLCPQSNPCTWQQVLTAFPSAKILPVSASFPNGGNLILKAGSHWSGFIGNADALTVGLGTTSATTFDFGPDTVTVLPGGNVVTAPGAGGGGGVGAAGTPGAAGTTTFTVGGPNTVTPAITPTAGIPTQVQGQQVTRPPSTHHQTKSPSNSNDNGWLWWLLLILAVAFAAFIWFLFTRSRSAGV